MRLMKADDFDAVVEIDRKVLGTSRPEYYEVKFEKLFRSKDYVPTSYNVSVLTKRMVRIIIHH